MGKTRKQITKRIINKNKNNAFNVPFEKEMKSPLICRPSSAYAKLTT